jgi:3-hydroxyisobutyrate dehydrogenase-like beta-hydroxyacid dehydrogenase
MPTHDSNKPPVTVLGLGPMGRSLAAALVTAGHPTTVWNRTAGKADGLGATSAATATEAVAASPLVIVNVLNYDAVEAILTPAAGALAGRTVVNLSNDQPGRARAMAGWAADQGADYLDGSIMTPIDTIGGPGAVVLYSGPEQVYRRHQPVLGAFGGTATYLGEDPGRAAAYDVSLLDLFWTSMAGLMHAFALARAEGVGPAELVPYAQGIGTLLPDLMPLLAQQLEAGDFDGTDSNLVSAASAIDHIVDASRGHGLDSAVIEAVRAIVQRALDAGHGPDSFTRLTETMTGVPAGR